MQDTRDVSLENIDRLQNKTAPHVQTGMSLVVVLMLLVVLTTISLSLTNDAGSQFQIVRNDQFYANAYHSAYSEINAQLDVINSNEQSEVDNSILWILTADVDTAQPLDADSLVGPHKGVGAFDQTISYTLACNPDNCPSPPGYSLTENTKVLRASIDSTADMVTSGAASRQRQTFWYLLPQTNIITFD